MKPTLNLSQQDLIMNRTRATAQAIALSALLFSTSAALAQRPLQFVVNGGAVVPTGGFKNANELGIHAAGSLILKIPGFPIRLRPELNFTRFNLKDEIAAATAAAGTTGTGGTSQMLGAMGNIEMPLFAGLYLLGGVGAMSLSTDAAAASTTFTGTKFSIDGGAGLRVRLGPVSAFIEGRVNNVYSDQGAIDFKNVRIIPVSFGLAF
jgi:hypothetical protein